MKTIIQNLLKGAGLYNRVKASRVYDVYWSIADKQVFEEREAELSFYRSLLQQPIDGETIFDIGANRGYKSSVFLQLGARVIAVDPDPYNQQVLSESFHSFRLKRKPVTIVPKAVSDSSGEITFFIDEPGSAKNTVSKKWVTTLLEDNTRFEEKLCFEQQQKVETTTLDELIREYGTPCFVKIDVEGHEPAVIQGLTQSVPLLSFEVNLPEFLDEGVECVRMLDAINPSGEFNFLDDSKSDAGLVLEEWLSCADFEMVLPGCSGPSIEIFWRTPGLV